MKVKVWNGNKTKYLGEGNYDEDVTVFFVVNKDESITSNPNAEEKPEGIPEEDIIKWEGNPKIVLDDGKVVYGCQVWWEVAEMEAKDRIVKCEDSCPDAGTPQCNDCDYGAAFEEGAAAQDEISFHLGMQEEASGGHNSISYLEGYQEGEKQEIKKVVEFIDWLDNGLRSSASWRSEMRKFRQAKLKELGVEGIKMNIAIVGKLVEHAGGDIDLCGWIFDCDCCSTIEEVIQTHRQELVKTAKEAGTYSYKKKD